MGKPQTNPARRTNIETLTNQFYVYDCEMSQMCSSCFDIENFLKLRPLPCIRLDGPILCSTVFASVFSIRKCS